VDTLIKKESKDGGWMFQMLFWSSTKSSRGRCSSAAQQRQPALLRETISSNTSSRFKHRHSTSTQMFIV